ncbi:hypothetical protein [Sporisorium scitamineum]|uniref:Uncharacterized protein n=1 Tax=Sporisorium scitamineum TaxID=49012 RepID=A0A0F7S180_9BASI|nr:hypothetical protein [Sporisorium scitamineum]
MVLQIRSHAERQSSLCQEFGDNAKSRDPVGLLA